MQQNTGSRFDFGDILCNCAPLDSLKILEVQTNPIFTEPAKSSSKRPMMLIGGSFYPDSTFEKALDGLCS
jgi:hypothetical protein